MTLRLTSEPLTIRLEIFIKIIQEIYIKDKDNFTLMLVKGQSVNHDKLEMYER